MQGFANAVADEAAAGEIKPATMQSFVAAMREAQLNVGILPEAVAPVPRDMAMQIGLNFTSAPDDIRKANAKLPKDAVKFKLRDELVARIEKLQETFGEYTDDVLVYALAEYTGMDKTTASVLTTLTDQLVNSKGPFQVDDIVDDAVAQEGMKNFSIFDVGARDLLGLPGGGLSPAPDVPDTLSPEERRRAAAAEAEETN